MREKIGRVSGVVGGVCGLIATAAIFLVPMYEGVSVTVTSSGERIEEHTRKTLLEMQALEPITIFFFGAIIIASLVAVICALRAKSRLNGYGMLAAGILLLLAAIISGFSVGGYYLPGSALVFFAGILMSMSPNGN